MCAYNCFTTAKQASCWLKDTASNNLLAYPTESVWGVGCDAMNKEAVQHVLAIKNRPIDKGMIVVTDSIQRIEPLLKNLTEQQQKIISNSWYASDTINQNDFSFKQNQAMTWLLPIPKGLPIPQWITGKHNTIAVRVIAHTLIQQLCGNLVSEKNPFGFIISTSCNPAGFAPAQNLEEAQSYFKEFDNVSYLQAETLGYSLPSQIRDGVSGLVIR